MILILPMRGGPVPDQRKSLTDQDPGCRTGHDRGIVRRRGARLAVSVGDSSAGQIVRGELDDNPVSGKNTDVVLPHLAGKMAKHVIATFEFDGKHRIRQRRDDRSINGNRVRVRFRRADFSRRRCF